MCKKKNIKEKKKSTDHPLPAGISHLPGGKHKKKNTKKWKEEEKNKFYNKKYSGARNRLGPVADSRVQAAKSNYVKRAKFRRS